MKARAQLTTHLHNGRSVPSILRSAPPLTMRATPGGVHLVGTAAGPLGGDHLHLAIEVGAHAELTLRSVAAQMVQPGAVLGNPSSMSVHAWVGPHGRMRLLPEPVVVVAGAHHTATTTIEMADGAIVVLREILVLGRYGEQSGSILSRLRIDQVGAPVLRTDVGLGPAWPASTSAAVAGHHRCVGHVVVIGTQLTPDQVAGRPQSGIGATELEHGGIMVTAIGDRVDTVRDRLDAAVAAVAGITRRPEGQPTGRAARP